MMIQNTGFFADTHQFIRGTAQNAKSAKVILLGERHDNVPNQIHNAYLIDQLYKEGDLILTETVERRIDPDVIDQQVVFLKGRRNIACWDSYTKRAPIYELNGKIENFLTTAKVLRDSVQSHCWTEKIRDLVPWLPKSLRKRVAEYSWEKIAQEKRCG